ncbi:MAG: dihydroneopterin aldolase [Candidatus Peribacteraceae bacterium]|nr:dihydroneopterin aldolase [Candidatus Peribacteraceae bacterium]
MDSLSLHSIEIWTRIGVPAEERAHPQRVLASVTMHMDLGRVCVSDDIADSVNYADIAHDILTLAQTERLTIERLAADIAKSVLTHAMIKSVTVTIEKFPIPGVASVSCSITRP